MTENEGAGLAAALADLVQKQIAAALPAARPSDTVLVELKEVTARTKLSRSTIYELAKSGELPVIRIRHRVYMRETDLAAFIDAHAVKGGAK